LLPDLLFDSPWLNAAGSLGFAPPAAWEWPEQQGAFVTNPVSLQPRTPAESRALIPFASGFLLHTGLVNPGLNAVLRHHAERWARSRLDIWVHLIGPAAEVNRMEQRLEDVEGVAGVELGIPPDADAEEALELVRAAQGELPVVVNIPLSAAGEPWLAELKSMGVTALCLGAPRGTLPAPDGALVSGRIYGPALLPWVFAAGKAARRWGLPLIAGAGVFRREDGQALLAAGFKAVQVDAALWG
jgi:dihydroorotate dehydrogenase (NAD+) catalytic subunit